VVAKLTENQWQDCVRELEGDHPEQFVSVKPGSYACDLPDEPDEKEPLTVKDVEAETLTASEVVHRWPALQDYYAEPGSSLYDAAKRGVIRRVPGKNGQGSPGQYVLDDAFYAWLTERVDLNMPGEPPDQDGTPKTGDPPGDRDAEPEHAPDVDKGAADEAEGETTGPEAGDDRPGFGQLETLVDDLVEAHSEYVLALTGLHTLISGVDQSDREARGNRVLELREQLRTTIVRLVSVYWATALSDVQTPKERALNDLVNDLSDAHQVDTPRLRASTDDTNGQSHN
jgi:hypothetical protein